MKKPHYDIPVDYINQAQKSNSDGYGLSYFDGTDLQVFKTFDFQAFKDKLATLTAFEVVAHLRAASIGGVSYENIHPFLIKDSTAIYHNGTLHSMKSISCSDLSCDDASDTRNLASLISMCEFNSISDVLPLIHQIAGDYSNKLVFHEPNGKVTIVNEQLGIKEDGIWYSNTYHVKPTYDYSTQFVFVYGTLKSGYRNNQWLGDSTCEGQGITCDKWAMIDGPGYPYLLQPSDSGHNIIGEIYSVASLTLKCLDQLEGAPHHYHRQLIDVECEDFIYPCITYVKTRVTLEDLAEDFIDEF